MARGVDTPAEKVAEFRAHYLLSGNAYGAAREVGIPESTGADIARGLKNDPSFVAARRELHDDYLQRHISMRMRITEIAADRFENGEVDVTQFGDNTTVVDKRPDYGKLVLDAEKNAHNLAKLEAAPTQGEGKPAAVTINISGPDGSAVSVD